VSEETKRAYLKLTGGAGLIAAASATAEHFAEEAGFDETTRVALVEACEQVCGDALDRAGNGGPLEVIVDQFEDRLEIVVTHPCASSPAIGLDEFIGSAQGPGAAAGASLLARVDRVRYETVDQTSRMVLVKYLPGKNTAAKKRPN
jgi:hypothetical protein